MTQPTQPLALLAAQLALLQGRRNLPAPAPAALPTPTPAAAAPAAARGGIIDIVV